MSADNKENKKIKLSDLNDNDTDAQAQEMTEKKSELKNNSTHDSGDPSSIMNGNMLPLPEVFQTDNVTFDERMGILADEIITACKPFEVEGGFAFYIDDYVQADGWEAIWQSHQLKCDVLVQVTEVQSNFHRATVELVMPFRYESESGQSITQQDVEQVLKGSKERVSLLELFPVFDESGDLDDTAIALEHLRFFYDYIWRLSEENDSDDYEFSVRHLHPRMKMYYDVKNKTVSAAVADKYLETMAEYQQKVWQLKLKRAQYDPDSDTEDEDEDGPEIPEADMIEMTELSEELDVLMNTLEKLEDPVMRTIVMKGSAKKKNKKNRSSEDRHYRPNQEVFTHLVAEKFTVAMIKKLALDDDTIIVQHSSLMSALDSCYNGDTVLLFPGVYSGEAFYNLNQSINIKGVGESITDIVILCQERVSIFVDCTAYRLHLSNMTFESEIQDSPSFAALDVRSGTTTVSNCLFKTLCKPVLVSKEGSLVMDKCEIQGFLSPGVKVASGGTLTLSNSHVYHCGEISNNTGNQDGVELKSGILIEVQADAEGLDQTTTTLHSNKIEDSKGSGICIMTYHKNFESMTQQPANVASDVEVASLLPSGMKWEAKDNTFNDNGDGNVCVRPVMVADFILPDIMDTSF